MQIKQTDVTILNSRGAALAATVFQPDVDSKAIETAVMLAPATGIKRQFYDAFANHLAEQGFAVVTFDNEGIGESKQGSGFAAVKKSDASLVTWGQHDMSAVLQKIKTEFPHARYHLVGHSAGGQLFGLMSNHADFSSVFNVACSSGCIANMRGLHQLKARWFMECFIPISNLIFGCARNDKVGMGEPLPKKVAKNWRDWCNGTGYVATAFGTDVLEHYYNEVILPAMWVNAIDDEIANNENVADMIRVFPHMQATTKTLVPAEHGLKEIGHMKFFSRKSHMLWGMATEWIRTH